jgi:hypothetical protein
LLLLLPLLLLLLLLLLLPPAAALQPEGVSTAIAELSGSLFDPLEPILFFCANSVAPLLRCSTSNSPVK